MTHRHGQHCDDSQRKSGVEGGRSWKTGDKWINGDGKRIYFGQ